MATRIYTERVRGVYYYQTNYLEPGARYPAKLLSGERLTLGEVLANLTYASAGEARRNRARTAAMAQRVVVLAGTAEAGPMFAADRVGGARIDLADAGLDLTGTP